MGQISLLSTLAWRNLWRHRRRTVIMLFAIALGTWLMIVTGAMSRGIIGQQIHDSIFNLTGHLQIHHPTYRDDPAIEHSMAAPNEALTAVLDSPEISHWSTRVRLPAVIMSERESSGVTLVGIDPNAERGLSFIGEVVDQGRPLASVQDPGIVIGRRLAERLETQMGKRIVIMAQDAGGEVADRGFRIVGLYRAEMAATEMAYVFTGRQTAQQMLGMGGQVSELAVMVADEAHLPALSAALKKQAADLEVMTWAELEPLMLVALGVYDGFMLVWNLIIFLAMSFGLINTLLMAVFERTREIGLYQALGMRPRFIVAQVLWESLILLALGLAAGNLVSGLTVAALADGIDLSDFARGMETFAMSSVLYLDMQLRDVLVANVMVIVLGLAASFYPAWRAARYVPVQAITRV